MSDFNKRLDEASQRGHEFVRKEMEAEEAARQLKMDDAKTREEAAHVRRREWLCDLRNA
jgi:hypothetical protein